MFTAYLVGVSHRPIEAQMEVTSLRPGMQLKLQREPTNEFDVNAVKVLDIDSHNFLGYIEKNVAAKISPLLAESDDYVCEVEDVSLKKKPLLSISFD